MRPCAFGLAILQLRYTMAFAHAFRKGILGFTDRTPYPPLEEFTAKT